MWAWRFSTVAPIDLYCWGSDARSWFTDLSVIGISLAMTTTFRLSAKPLVLGRRSDIFTFESEDWLRRTQSGRRRQGGGIKVAGAAHHDPPLWIRE